MNHSCFSDLGAGLGNMFCPFKDAAARFNDDDGEEEDSDRLSSEDDEDDRPLNNEDEIRMLEEMMKAGMKGNGVKCPFPRQNGLQYQNKATEISQKSQPLNHQQLQQMIEKSGGECPFKFAMKPGADSEDEADIPKSHVESGRCPLAKGHRKENDEGRDGERKEEVAPESVTPGMSCKLLFISASAISLKIKLCWQFNHKI